MPWHSQLRVGWGEGEERDTDFSIVMVTFNENDAAAFANRVKFLVDVVHHYFCTNKFGSLFIHYEETPTLTTYKQNR